MPLFLAKSIPTYYVPKLPNSTIINLMRKN